MWFENATLQNPLEAAGCRPDRGRRVVSGCKKLAAIIAGARIVRVIVP